MLRYKSFILLAGLLMALLIACSPTGGEPGGSPTATATTQPAETPAADSDAATAAATAQLATELGLTESEIEVVSVEPAEFTDSCLGLGGPEESCLQAMTPGWVVMLSAGGQEYEVHTDETGDQARVAGDMAGGATDAITASAVAVLADQLGLTPTDIEVVSAAPAEFSDSCLGLGGPEESCLQAITPGWLVMLSAGGQEYEVHTDETGVQVRVAGETPAGDEAADTIAAAAQEFLVAELGVALGDVQVISTEPAEFSDSCLGLGGPEESCLQAMTPGWIVMVDVAGQEYEVHTDESGQQVRVAD